MRVLGKTIPKLNSEFQLAQMYRRSHLPPSHSQYSRSSADPPEGTSTGLGTSGLRTSGLSLAGQSSSGPSTTGVSLPGVGFGGSCFTTLSSSGLSPTGPTTTGMRSQGLMASGSRFVAWLLVLSNDARLCWPVSSKQEMNKGRARLPRVSRSVISCLA